MQETPKKQNNYVSKTLTFRPFRQASLYSLKDELYRKEHNRENRRKK